MEASGYQEIVESVETDSGYSVVPVSLPFPKSGTSLTSELISEDQSIRPVSDGWWPQSVWFCVNLANLEVPFLEFLSLSGPTLTPRETAWSLGDEAKQQPYHSEGLFRVPKDCCSSMGTYLQANLLTLHFSWDPSSSHSCWISFFSFSAFWAKPIYMDLGRAPASAGHLCCYVWQMRGPVCPHSLSAHVGLETFTSSQHLQLCQVVFLVNLFFPITHSGSASLIET